MTTATPVVLFGLNALVAQPVIDALKPEYEVIHFFDNVAQGTEDLPRLLASQTPQQPSAHGIASQNYAQPPQAVILGRGFNDDMVTELRNAIVKDDSSAPGVPWVIGGLSSVESNKFKTGERKAPDPTTYGPQVAALVKEVFAKVKAEGKWEQDGVWVWAEELNKKMDA